MTRLVGIPRKRMRTHGAFADSAAVSQHIKAAMASAWQWEQLSAEHREALQMIAFKTARIICGDADFRDHWDDIAGYAQLASAAGRRGGAS